MLMHFEIICFSYLYFTSYWNQMGVLRGWSVKFVMLMFVMAYQPN
jgi:hypothetical protein